MLLARVVTKYARPSPVHRFFYKAIEDSYDRSALHPEVYSEEVLDGSLERIRAAERYKKEQEKKTAFLRRIEESIKKDGINPDQIGISTYFCHVQYRAEKTH
jgi:hypothetical protein